VFFSFVFADGKESIKDPHGKRHSLQKMPTGNVYIKDHEKQQHRKAKG
jgi:hypothetical protein